MNHALWVAVLTALLILLGLALRPFGAWLGSYVHWRRHERRQRDDGGGARGARPMICR